MDTADRILLAIEAREVWDGFRALSAHEEPFGLEPVVCSDGGDDFGTIAGSYSVAELQDLIALWQYRMAQLAQSYADASPSWVQKDSKAFIEFTNDWNVLQNRYAAALKDAQAKVGIAAYTLPYVGMPNSVIPAQDEYVGLMKAMRQCAPPDGCPVQKGDWADLWQRLSAITSVPDHPPQPTATDADLEAFKAGTQADIVAQVTGAQAPTAGPLPASWVTGTGGPLGFLSNHKTAIVLGLVLVAAAVTIPILAGPLKMLKGAAALAA